MLLGRECTLLRVRRFLSRFHVTVDRERRGYGDGNNTGQLTTGRVVYSGERVVRGERKGSLNPG